MGTFAETANIETAYRLPTKEKNLPLFIFCVTENQQKFAVSVFRLQQTNRSCRFPYIQKENGLGFRFPFETPAYTYIHRYIYIYLYYIHMLQFKWKTENGSPGDFPQSLYHWLIVQTEVCHLSVCL
jgi:hypothetical protein